MRVAPVAWRCNRRFWCDREAPARRAGDRREACLPVRSPLRRNDRLPGLAIPPNAPLFPVGGTRRCAAAAKLRLDKLFAAIPLHVEQRGEITIVDARRGSLGDQRLGPERDAKACIADPLVQEAYFGRKNDAERIQALR